MVCPLLKLAKSIHQQHQAGKWTQSIADPDQFGFPCLKLRLLRCSSDVKNEERFDNKTGKKKDQQLKQDMIKNS